MRTWIILAAVFAVTAVYSVLVILHMVLWRNHDVFYVYARSWSKLLLKLCRIQVHTVGIHNLSGTGRYIYVANHASLFDIPVILVAVPDNIRIMYKHELERIPIFGWCLKISPFIAINRNRGKQASDVLDTVAETLGTGTSVLVFPEGTRSEDGSVGPFRRGAFSLAVRSKRALVPLAITGTAKILPKGASSISGGRVTVVIGSQISTETTYSREQEKELMATVRDIICVAVDSHL